MLTSVYDIKNFDELNDELIELLKQFDKDLNSYDTDVYMYYDEDTNTATLDTFVNPGGNSWLNDDSYLIYTDKQHYDSVIDWFDGDLVLIADCLNKTVEDLYDEYIDVCEIDADDTEYVDDSDVIRYVASEDYYFDQLCDIYWDAIDNDYNEEFANKARYIWDKFDEHLALFNDED